MADVSYSAKLTTAATRRFGTRDAHCLWSPIALVVLSLVVVSCKPAAHRQSAGVPSGSAQVADERPKPDFIPLVRLLSSPTSFEGSLVGVQGFVTYDFEGTAIYPSQDDYLNGLMGNALWLDFTNEDDKVATDDHEYCLVIGTFRASHHGHLGVFSGTILVDTVRGCRDPVHARRQSNGDKADR